MSFKIFSKIELSKIEKYSFPLYVYNSIFFCIIIFISFYFSLKKIFLKIRNAKKYYTIKKYI